MERRRVIGPVETVRPGVVLLQGPALVDTYRCVRDTVATLGRLDGVVPPERLRNLVDVLEVNAAAALGVSVEAVRGSARNVRRDPVPAESDPSSTLTTEEAAMILDLSTRQIRRLAEHHTIAGRRLRGRWVFDRAVVVAAAADRAAA